MRQRATLSGILGAALFLFGLATYFFTSGSLIARLHLFFGGLLLLVYLATNLRELWRLSAGRATRTVASALAGALLLLVILVAANLIATLYPKQFDLTREGLYSLSPQTRKLLAGLEEPVEALAFKQGGAYPEAEDLLRLYAYESRKFRYRIVDPDREPQLANRHQVRQDGTIVLVAGARTKKVNEVSEEALTNALLELLAGRTLVIAFTTDHGERDIEDQQTRGGYGLLKAWLEEQNYEVRAVSLIREGKVPDDVDVLVLAAPQQPLFPGEVSEIQRWVRAGGALLVLADPFAREAQPVLDPLGVKLGADVILDQQVRLFAGPTLGTQLLVDTYGDHPAVADFHDRTIFVEACSLEKPASPPPGVELVDLVRTSPTSWAERDLKRLFQEQTAELDSEDEPGPVTIGLAFTGYPGATTPGAGEQGARGVVLCDSDAFTNRMLPSLGNRDLVLNLVAWLAGEHQKIAIRPHKRGASRLVLTTDEMVQIFYLTVLIGPELLLFAGIVVWWTRRRWR